MLLIGMLDSPYVRRVAVSLKLMGVPFEHRAVSVFRHMDEFRKVNPVVKAPTLVADDGTMLMDSTLILDHVESTLPESRRLMPADPAARLGALHVLGLALAATDKGVSIVYEHERRPAEKVHQPWLDRVVAQANTACAELEKIAAKARPWIGGAKIGAADVMAACGWRFNQSMNGKDIPAARYPALAALCARAEALPEFSSTPTSE
ncbi:MAG TPA: glutathione S-transferase family protein [Usitatibacter sp.]|nr:glutathione S-transferase family protein [Usitatibacter sp.]HST01274.1 glutathione S-transferase family protein [Usitatibacter sp.]